MCVSNSGFQKRTTSASCCSLVALYTLYLHVVRKDPQPGEIVLQEDVDRDELQVRAQQRLVVARVRSRYKQSVSPEN